MSYTSNHIKDSRKINNRSYDINTSNYKKLTTNKDAKVIVIIIKKLMVGTVAGYSSIVALILMFGGLQLLCIGILGEYLAKIYVQVKNRPVYIVSKKYSYEDENKE